jgi:hypothetical protein
MLRRSAAVIVSGAIALGGAALLVPHPASAADKAVASVGDQAEGKGHGKLLTPADRRTLRKDGHVTITRDTKKRGTVTVLLQLGKITAISPTSVSLMSKDGYTHSYVLTDKTKIKEKRATVPLSEVKVGQKALIVAVQGDTGDNARRLVVRQGAPVA